MRRARSLLAFSLLAIAALALPAGADAKNGKLRPVKGPVKAAIGIADQKPDLFTDPRFVQLGLRQARRSIGWDTMQYDWQVADVDAWMLAARRAGVTPLITFARSRIAERRHLTPTPEQIRRAFVAFRARYPWATDFVASNESNHGGEPTFRRPGLAARYYKAMRRACPTCRIAAATLLDYPNLVTWAKAFVKAAHEQPRYWALHNYVSANRFDLQRTRAFLRAVKGDVWITEVGGAVLRKNPQVTFPEGIGHAAKVTRFIFRRIAPLSPRITRIYLYHWNSTGPDSTWDSGLIDAAGRPRPALTVFERMLRRIRGARSKRGSAKGRLPVIEGTLPAR